MRPVLFLVLLGLLAGCNSTPDGPVTEEGTLATGDATLTTGEFQDSYDVTMSEGQWLRVTLNSSAFDPYLVVRFPSGQQSDLDDSTPGDTTSVTMILRAQEAGTFNIIVTSYRPGATGAYSVTYEVSDTEPAGGATDTAGSAPAEEITPDAGTDPPAPDVAPDGGNTIGEIDGGDAAPVGEDPKPEEGTLDA